MLQVLLPTITLLALLNPGNLSLPEVPGAQLMAEKQLPLYDRYGNRFVNDVFRDNILLNMAYLEGKVPSSGNINWDEVKKPFSYQFTLKPGQTFAFHEDVLPQFKGKVVKTTNAHFNAADGFKSDGYLFGDGVCHLASIINFAAKTAGLEVLAPTNHNFANIPDVPKEYGVSIYNSPDAKGASAQQNLYITNNFSSDVTFDFEYQNDVLKVSVYRQLNPVF